MLIVKMSSLGDVVHTLPALTDAVDYRSDIRFDWVVEEAFKDIPRMHPAVEEVLPVAIRRWRGNWLASSREVRAFLGRLRQTHYDLIIDAQGLIKSALVTRFCEGEKCGLDRRSARESLASLAYDRKIYVERGQHAVERTRALFADAIGYARPRAQARYGLLHPARVENAEKTIMLLHGTTWPSKQWPLACWQQLGALIEHDGYRVALPFGDPEEEERAEEIAGALGAARILPRVTLGKLAEMIAAAAGVVTVDSGLGHLAAALDVPLVALYGPTDPTLTGMYGMHQTVLVGGHLPCIPCLKRDCMYRRSNDSSKIYPPCFASMTPAKVWAALKFHIAQSNRDER